MLLPNHIAGPEVGSSVPVVHEVLPYLALANTGIPGAIAEVGPLPKYTS